jgi:hypothetical protein
VSAASFPCPLSQGGVFVGRLRADLIKPRRAQAAGRRAAAPEALHLLPPAARGLHDRGDSFHFLGRSASGLDSEVNVPFDACCHLGNHESTALQCLGSAVRRLVCKGRLGFVGVLSDVSRLGSLRNCARAPARLRPGWFVRLLRAKIRPWRWCSSPGRSPCSGAPSRSKSR